MKLKLKDKLKIVRNKIKTVFSLITYLIYIILYYIMLSKQNLNKYEVKRIY